MFNKQYHDTCREVQNNKKSQKAPSMAEIPHLKEAQVRKKVNELEKNSLYYLSKIMLKYYVRKFEILLTAMKFKTTS